MKNLIVITGFIFIGLSAFASDQMMDEIVCNKVHEAGSADNGLTITLQSNASSWVKLVQITENGVLGPRLIGTVQVPVQPELTTSSGGFIPEIDMIYKGKEATLTIRALDIDRDPLLLQGTGSIDLRLPGYEPETIALECQYTN